jgi:predicted negative regulator of RcsB-dependent stress response
MNRDGLTLIIGALVVVIGVVGYLYYQDRQQTAGVDISVGKSSISIQTK